ncbi:MAG TPA: CocE/NonD family hydrolase, partial [Candidatus Thermoplasmatota archaeon]|nr:CocE/NonD family hydrolase [Candidatus Thermoplasmatota archaeon]
ILESVDLPFETNLTIPEGTTLVRATAVADPTGSLGITLSHAETGRRRCNLNTVEDWATPRRGTVTCSGVTFTDKLPDAWKVRATGGVGVADLVTVELLTTPPDGLLAELDLTQLSQREYELEETKVEMVPSFDGTLLRVETTLPKGEGPWPVILWSSPYSHADRLTGNPAAWTYFVKDWAERGYAVVAADVRGYGESEGCVETWGPNEQQDQVFLVEWAASQPWSDGRVGFYGQSYVATTPVEAAVYGPEALKAIVIVAPVMNAYNDWHYGGVPNGENALSPFGYQTIGGGVDPFGLLSGNLPDAQYAARRADNGFCDPMHALRPNDPRQVYDDYYETRNFSARAKEVKAAVLYTQGFEDANVKAAMIPGWFNDLEVPKLGVFGHWVHQHPTRADNEVLFLGWMDQYVKGKPVGFEKLPPAVITTNVETQRVDTAWPPLNATLTHLYPDFAGGALGAEPEEGSAGLYTGLAAEVIGMFPMGPRVAVVETEPLTEALHVAGELRVRVVGYLDGAENAYLGATLQEETTNATRLVTYGMFNLAHRFGHDRYAPMTPDERFEVELPLVPTEWVFQPGAKLVLTFHAVTSADTLVAYPPVSPGVVTLLAGPEGSALVLPTLDGVTGVTALPATAQR